ncbi:FliH/SctL family protein [Thermoanaerobacterium sp. DL9XJH110]|uniref:FliH/SctL family protein n=1 Tax=Thermoanaerobacterium sp. DL9XJH110 TaxID=3386643 RepID=UPI003BB77EFB
MSKVLKYVEIKNENPFILKDFRQRMAGENPPPALDRLQWIHGKFREYEAQLMEGAVQRAQEIVAEAKKEAERVISNALADKERIEKEAYERGYEEGYRKGLELSRKENEALWADKLSQFNKLRQELTEQNREFRNYLEREAVKLALFVAEKVIGQKVETDLDSLVGLVKQGLQKAGEERDIVIRLCDSDFERISMLKKDLYRLKPGVKKINLIRDPTLTPGDCIIESDYFEIDAGIHAQVENIRQVLKEMDVIDNG